MSSNLLLALRVLGLFLLLSAVAPQASWAATLASSEAKVEVTLPAGWTLGKVPGLANELGFGPEVDGFRTNVNIVAEKFAGTLPQYKEANLKTLQTVMKGFRLVSQQDLKSDSGIALAQLVSDSNMVQPLRQVFYLGQGKDGYYFVVACSVVPQAAEKMQSVFDQIAKSVAYQ